MAPLRCGSWSCIRRRIPSRRRTALRVQLSRYRIRHPLVPACRRRRREIAERPAAKVEALIAVELELHLNVSVTDLELMSMSTKRHSLSWW